MSSLCSPITAVSGKQDLVDTVSSFMKIPRPRILSTVEEMRLPFSFRFPDGDGNEVTDSGASVTILKRSRPSSRPPSHAFQPSSLAIHSATGSGEDNDKYDSEDEEVWLGDDSDYPSDVEVTKLPPIDAEKQAALLAKSREVAYNEWLNATHRKVSNTWGAAKKRKLHQSSSLTPASTSTTASDDTTFPLQDLEHLLLHPCLPDIDSSLLAAEESSTGSRRYKNHWVHHITEANPYALSDSQQQELHRQSEIRQLQFVHQIYKQRLKNEVGRGFALTKRWCEETIAMLDARLKELGIE